mmetsp:Transcript_101724/g.270610  ORF Transcript_101724/g.270610 Transcript_101724/m.270610 type:complete len:298 (-) Transcript_101724:64-957(-)
MPSTATKAGSEQTADHGAGFCSTSGLASLLRPRLREDLDCQLTECDTGCHARSKQLGLEIRNLLELRVHERLKLSEFQSKLWKHLRSEDLLRPAHGIDHHVEGALVQQAKSGHLIRPPGDHGPAQDARVRKASIAEDAFLDWVPLATLRIPREHWDVLPLGVVVTIVIECHQKLVHFLTRGIRAHVAPVLNSPGEGTSDVKREPACLHIGNFICHGIQLVEECWRAAWWDLLQIVEMLDEAGAEELEDGPILHESLLSTEVRPQWLALLAGLHVLQGQAPADRALICQQRRPRQIRH